MLVNPYDFDEEELKENRELYAEQQKKNIKFKPNEAIFANLHNDIWYSGDW